MARGVNKVIIIGVLGKDPEVRHLANGDAVANVSVATNEEWKDKNGEKQKRTEWINLVFWKRLAEIAGEYLKKGSVIYVEGKLKTDKYQKDGQDHYATKVHVSEMQMLGGGREKQSGSADDNEPRQSEQKQDQSDAEFDDDIPF